jgi:hypothetical protein
MSINLFKIDNAKKLFNMMKGMTRIDPQRPPGKEDPELSASEAGRVIQKFAQSFDDFAKSEVMMFLGSKVEDILNYFKNTEFIALEPAAFGLFLKLTSIIFENKEFQPLTPFVCRFVKTVIVINAFVVEKNIESRRTELVRHCCHPVVRTILFESFLVPTTFDFKNYFGAFDRHEEYLYFSMEKLLIDVLSCHSDSLERVQLLSLLFANHKGGRIEYFPLSLYLYTRELNLELEHSQIDQNFFDFLLAYIQTDLHDKLLFLFNFVTKYIAKLTETNVIKLSNFMIEKFEKLNFFDFKLTLVHITLAGKARSFPVKNHVSYIEKNFVKYKVVTEFLENIHKVLEEFHWSRLQFVELDPELSFDENTLRLVSDLEVVNKLYILRFIARTFEYLKPKGKQIYANKLLVFLKDLFVQTPFIQSSLLLFIFDNVFACKDAEVREVQMELQYYIVYYFETRHEEELYKIISREMFQFFTSPRAKGVSYQLLLNIDYFFKFLTNKSQALLILAPYVLSVCLCRKFLEENRSLFFGIMQRLLQVLTIFRTMPVLYIKNSNESFDWLKKDDLMFQTITSLRFFEPSFVEKFILIQAKDLKRASLPNEYFFFLSMYWSKCPDEAIRLRIFDYLLNVMGIEFDTPHCMNFFNVIDFFEYLALHFYDTNYFGRLNKQVVSLFEFCRSKNYTSNDGFIKTKICNLFRILLLHLKAYQHSALSFPESLSVYLDKCFPDSFSLFQNAMISLLLSDELTSTEPNSSEVKELEDLRFIGSNCLLRKLTDGHYYLRDTFGKHCLSFTYKTISSKDEENLDNDLDSEITELFMNGYFENNLINKKVIPDERRTITNSLICSLDSTEVKNLFKSGILYLAPEQHKWEHFYENNSGTIKSERYHQFISAFCENLIVHENYARIDNFMDQYKIFIGSKYRETEVFEKRRAIGNAPFLILFDESELTIDKISETLTPFNVFVVIISRAINSLYTIEVINQLAHKIPPIEFSELLFRLNEVVDFVRLLLVKFSKYIDEVLFQEKSFHSLESGVVSNSLYRRDGMFNKIYTIK